MSVLASFLLATSLWSDDGQLSARQQTSGGGMQPQAALSMLVSAERIWIGSTHDGAIAIDRAANEPVDWLHVEEVLRQFKVSLDFADRVDVEIAVQSTPAGKVAYGDLIAAMDSARAAGFVEPLLGPAEALSNLPMADSRP